MYFSPDITIGLPYGERRVKTSDGTVSTISNTLRLYRNEVRFLLSILWMMRLIQDIIRMFERYMKETGHEDELLSRSSMIRILDTCSATRRHALTCVDYFVAAGTNVRLLSAFPVIDSCSGLRRSRTHGDGSVEEWTARSWSREGCSPLPNEESTISEVSALTESFC